MTGFWEYALVTQKMRADPLGSFLRLMDRKVVARPREVGSPRDLIDVLADQRVRITDETARRAWENFVQHKTKAAILDDSQVADFPKRLPD